MSPSTELNFYEGVKEFSEHFLTNYLVIGSFFGDVFGVTEDEDDEKEMESQPSCRKVERPPYKDLTLRL